MDVFPLFEHLLRFGRLAEPPTLLHWDPLAGDGDLLSEPGRVVGKESLLVYGTLHGPGYAGAGGLGSRYRNDEPIADDFHTFAIEWDFEGIRWFFDGEMYGKEPGHRRGPMGLRQAVLLHPQSGVGRDLPGTHRVGRRVPEAALRRLHARLSTDRWDGVRIVARHYGSTTSGERSVGHWTSVAPQGIVCELAHIRFGNNREVFGGVRRRINREDRHDH